MYATGAKFCDFVTWTPIDVVMVWLPCHKTFIEAQLLLPVANILKSRPDDNDKINELDVIKGEESEIASESEEVSPVNANVDDRLDGNDQNPRPAEIAKSTIQKYHDVLQEMQNMK